MMDLILGVAERDECVRIVVLSGSRANPNAPKDTFSTSSPGPLPRAEIIAWRSITAVRYGHGVRVIAVSLATKPTPAAQRRCRSPEAEQTPSLEAFTPALPAHNRARHSLFGAQSA